MKTANELIKQGILPTNEISNRQIIKEQKERSLTAFLDILSKQESVIARKNDINQTIRIKTEW